VLELSWPCSAADVRRAYRRLALERHPDRGGTDAAFHALTRARDAVLRELSAP
jgi:curved DNA-binding protein CbpA